ncbi:Xaa-Pro aminopeptidase/Xaa-Pro dipeptidase [Entomoplasma freundtii]|uniref:Xaa-Pro dipeptidase n=1 Tax=Entomoplasma freundtii TaxID=74700 RepID=A0A2K8NRU2_9MOLU|nr:Xaa-Pro peptidase family protein [Entomoplasma freundtii]ATZ16497.1 Xaa-Pro dipeptidase [Entomoplasma freundtii]TDY56026.1 Xaa-Pro aminopeptidase/Xaa-Pro dipeptidase [Entomoplasma freundtii]
MIKKIIQANLANKDLKAMLLYSPQNRYWFSHFPSSLGYILVTPEENYLFVDGRYITAARENKSLINIDKIVLLDNQTWRKIAQILASQNINKLGFESDWVTYVTFENWTKLLPKQHLVPVNTEKWREVKSDWEVAQIQKACDITDAVFQDVIKWVKPGISEKDLARFVSDSFLKHGADKLSFDTIVASGQNGSKPHAVPTNKLLENGDLVTLDMGCYANGYVSDQTRTFALGNVTPELKKIYETVFEAQSLGISLLKAGQNAGDVHRAVANYISEAGYGEYFTHGLGHGMGIEIHEEPYENASSQSILEPGMVVTVEPGIYIPGVGGVRIEDDFLITNTGSQRLTSSPRELIIVKPQN